MRKQSHCALGRERIHGYLDGALPAEELEQVAAHVAACDQCREEVAQFRVLKAALHEMRTPPGAGEARGRVFARYREVEPSISENLPQSPAAAAMSAHHWTRHPSLTLALAAAAAALIAFLPPVSPRDSPPALLPSPVEMSVLSERHDLHVAHVEERPVGADSKSSDRGEARGE